MQGFNLDLPKSVRSDFSNKKIVFHLLQEALAKHEFYQSQQHFFEEKYHCSFKKMNAKLKHKQQENFELWDDLMEWEASYIAGKNWQKKYRDLLNCFKLFKN